MKPAAIVESEDGHKNGGDVIDIGPVAAAVYHQNASTARKSRFSTKHVIILVSIIMIVAMVITGILVGVKFFLDSSNQLVKRSFELKAANGRTIQEDATADVTDNLVQYYTKDGDSEVWVINDFNRDLQTMKVKQQRNYYVCYISPLNRSNTALPENFNNLTEPSGEVSTINKYYRRSPAPINDKYLMGTKARKLCQNFDVYWLTKDCTTEQLPTPNLNVTSQPGRQKRWFQCVNLGGFCGFCGWFCFRCEVRWECRWVW